MSKFLIRMVTSGVKFDLKADNGETVATSEVYTTAAACRRGIDSVRKSAPTAAVEDRTESDFTPAAHPKFELYRDRAGAYRFRLKSGNGRVIAVSEGYAGKSGCLSGIESVKKSAAEAIVE